MSNQKNSTNHVTELFIADLGRVTGGTFTMSGAEGGNHSPTTWSLVGTEEGGGGSAPTSQMVGEGGGSPNFPNLPDLPVTKMLGEGCGTLPPLTSVIGESGGGSTGKPA